MNEQFVNIMGYESYYQISNLGRIKSLRKSRFLSHTLNKKNGYYYVGLSKDLKTITFLLHRLIAIHFTPNPYNKLEVNQIKGVKTDNRIENLEWVTHKENSHHAWRLGLKVAAMTGITGAANKRSIPIVCINTGETFASIADAAKILKIVRPNIIKVLKGKRKRVSGLTFKYKTAI